MKNVKSLASPLSSLPVVGIVVVPLVGVVE